MEISINKKQAFNRVMVENVISTLIFVLFIQLLIVGVGFIGFLSPQAVKSSYAYILGLYLISLVGTALSKGGALRVLHQREVF